MTYFCRSVLRHLERGSTSDTVAQTPLWLPEAVVLLGLILLGLQLLAILVGALSPRPARPDRPAAYVE